MKKITYLLVTLFMLATIVSCNKDMINDDEADLLKKAKLESVSLPTASLPQSDALVIPYIIPGANRGGNRTCAEVATALDLFPNPFYCGDKLDYVDYEFSGMWPEGLVVTVTDGKNVSFEMEGCIMLGDKYYKVGAVIVKGSAAANVYYYGPDGTLEDSGLASPLNASGNPAGLSNLTFCFIECEQELIIAAKVWYKDAYDVWGASTGTNLFTSSGLWCKDGKLGINSYPGTSNIPIHQAYTDVVVGSISVINGIVTITLNDGLVMIDAHIFIGTKEELLHPDNLVDGCPDYTNDPWVKYVAPND